MKEMFKLTPLMALLLMLTLPSCENQDVDFPDYVYSTTYFPYKYPVRTLVLGDYYFDNENDNNWRFVISAAIGGLRENKEERIVDFVVDESLVADMYIGTRKILPLPSGYYQLSNQSRMIVPKGEMSGGVTVQLTEEFFNDLNSVSIKYQETVYVIPLRITGSTTDSVIIGKPAVENPDPRNPGDWDIVPKNYTLFGVNYVNEYHGDFLLRGASIQCAAGASIDTTIVYRTSDVETDRVIEVNTASRNSVTVTKDIARRKAKSPGNFTMLITFDDSGNGTVTKDASSAFQVTGTAKFVKDSESWGGKSRHAIYLDYTVDDGTHLNKAKDTLVFRSKRVFFQEFSPTYNP